MFLVVRRSADDSARRGTAFSGRKSSSFVSSIIDTIMPEESPEQMELVRALSLVDSWAFDVSSC